ncbi:MAG TPA: hypothetical protein VEU30_14245, partial [Thermoanaerobaculia bacterium]|nr:hypothetical protein [Thermoanaerobaculia bacterium]
MVRLTRAAFWSVMSVVWLLAGMPARGATIVANGGACTLEEAIDSVNAGVNQHGCVASGAYGTNDTIQLAYNVTLPTPIISGVAPGGSRAGLPQIARPVTIVPSGGPRTIGRAYPDCINNSDDYAIFIVQAALTLRGTATDKLTLQNGCVSAPGGPVAGGAVYVQTGSLTAEHTIFRNNYAISLAGASEGHGGAVYASPNTALTITNSTFENNLLRSTGPIGRGGAIYAENATVDIRDSVFSNNSTNVTGSQASYGGALYATGNRGLILEDVVFLSNFAQGEIGAAGGAMYGNLSAAASSIQLRRLVFKDNHAADVTSTQPGWVEGGAIYMKGRLGSLTDSLFDRNHATGAADSPVKGGALAVRGEVTAITNTTFRGNYVETANSSAEGGALHLAVYPSGSAIASSIRNVTFFENYARANNIAETARGGAMFSTSYTVTMSHVTMTANYARRNGSSGREGGGLWVGGT